MKWIIGIYFFLVFAGCKRGNHQVVALRNLSSEDVYFLIPKNEASLSADEITLVRPITSVPMDRINAEYADKEEAKSVKQNLYRYLIAKDSSEIILTSGSVSIFVDANSIQNIIKDRFNGELNIFIVTKTDLEKYSDQEIIDKKLCRYFRTLKAEDIKEDTLTLKYP